MKKKKFHIGDSVYWLGHPKEFPNNMHGGIIVSIKGDFAFVTKEFSNKIRQVPLKILHLRDDE